MTTQNDLRIKYESASDSVKIWGVVFLIGILAIASFTFLCTTKTPAML